MTFDTFILVRGQRRVCITVIDAFVVAVVVLVIVAVIVAVAFGNRCEDRYCDSTANIIEETITG